MAASLEPVQLGLVSLHLHLSLEPLSTFGQLALEWMRRHEGLLLSLPLLWVTTLHVPVQATPVVEANPVSSLVLADLAAKHPFAIMLILLMASHLPLGPISLGAAVPATDEGFELQMHTVNMPLEVSRRGEAPATMFAWVWPLLLVDGLDMP